MNTYETLKNEAETKIKPLADHVATLRRRMAATQKRADDETENAERMEHHLAELKELAAERLTQDSGAFDRWQTSFKRMTARLATTRESVKLFIGEIIPHQRTELEAAILRLNQEFTALYVAKRPECEASMSAALNQVVETHDAFLAAFTQMSRDYQASLNIGNMSCPRPAAIHARIDSIARYLTKLPALTFTAPPAQAAPPAPPAPATTQEGQQAPTPLAESEATPIGLDDDLNEPESDPFCEIDAGGLSEAIPAEIVDPGSVDRQEHRTAQSVEGGPG